MPLPSLPQTPANKQMSSTEYHEAGLAFLQVGLKEVGWHRGKSGTQVGVLGGTAASENPRLGDTLEISHGACYGRASNKLMVQSAVKRSTTVHRTPPPLEPEKRKQSAGK